MTQISSETVAIASIIFIIFIGIYESFPAGEEFRKILTLTELPFENYMFWDHTRKIITPLNDPLHPLWVVNAEQLTSLNLAGIA
jgi:hypothetical protein